MPVTQLHVVHYIAACWSLPYDFFTQMEKWKIVLTVGQKSLIISDGLYLLQETHICSSATGSRVITWQHRCSSELQEMLGTRTPVKKVLSPLNSKNADPGKLSFQWNWVSTIQCCVELSIIALEGNVLLSVCRKEWLLSILVTVEILHDIICIAISLTLPSNTVYSLPVTNYLGNSAISIWIVVLEGSVCDLHLEISWFILHKYISMGHITLTSLSIFNEGSNNWVIYTSAIQLPQFILQHIKSNIAWQMYMALGIHYNYAFWTGEILLSFSMHDK